MADPLTPLLQPGSGSIRCRIDDTFLVLESGTFTLGETLLISAEGSTAPPNTVLIYADTIELTTQVVKAYGCNVGLFCRSLSIGQLGWAGIITSGRPGAPVVAQTLTTDNNGQNAGNISVYVEKWDSAKLTPGNGPGGRTGFWIGAHGGHGGNATGQGSPAGNGGNGGVVQMSYVPLANQLMCKLNKIYTDTLRPFRQRAKDIATLLTANLATQVFPNPPVQMPPSMTPEALRLLGPQPQSVSVAVKAVQDAAAAFESDCVALDALKSTLVRIKHIFRSLVPDTAKAPLNLVIQTLNTLLRSPMGPRFDWIIPSTEYEALNTTAATIVKIPVESATIPWSDFATDLNNFSLAISGLSYTKGAIGPGAHNTLRDSIRSLEQAISYDNEGVNLRLQVMARGVGGLAGTGAPAGSSCHDGTTALPVIQYLKPESPDLKSPIAYAHPDQCQMLLDVANAAYLAASCDTTGNDTTRFEKAKGLYESLFNRLSFVPLLQQDVGSNPAQPMTQAYARMQAAKLCLDAFADLSQIHMQAGLSLCNIAHGKDMFGHNVKKGSETFWVPRLPCTKYYDAIKLSLPKLNQLVSNMTSQQGVQQDAKYDVELEATSAQAHIETLQQQIQLATSPTGTLKSAASQIEQYTPALKAMRLSVQSMISSVIDEIQNSINVNPTDIISGISQFAANPNELSAGSSIFSEMYTASSTVESSDGTDINKNYVVKEFTSAGSSLADVSEKVEMTASGTYAVDDPGAAKLIADEKTLDNLLDQFEGAINSSDVQTLRQTLHEYLTLAKRRNAAVLKYNTTALMVFKAIKNLKYFTNKSSILSGKELMSDPRQGSLLLFQLKIFNSMCSTTYELIFDAARSMQFWTLDNQAQVAPPLPSSGFNDVDIVTKLKSYVEQLSDNFTTWLTQYASNPGFVFPNRSTSQSTGGITWTLHQDKVSGLRNSTVSDLTSSTGEKEHQITFTLPVPTSSSTATPGTPDYNPFTGDANVRLDQVLVWLYGATVQPNTDTQQSTLTLEISHMGDDTIVANDGKTVSKFQHSATQLKFAYDPTNVSSWAAALKTNPIIVQNLDSGGEGVGRDSAMAERDLSVAPIGPFATWLLTVRERENIGLDLSKLTGICLEFWGSAHTVEGA